MRMLGASPYLLRAASLPVELRAQAQVAYVTNESARRTEMIQAQVAGEENDARYAA